MSFPSCKLIALDAPAGAPNRLALGIVVGNFRTLVQELELQNGTFGFDDETFVPFEDPDQLVLGLNILGTAQDAGVVVISASDQNQVLTQKFDQFDRLYQLTYKVLPGD